MIKYNVAMCCYDKMLVNVAACVIPGQVSVWCGMVWFLLLSSTHTSHQELHMQPHLPCFCHNNTLLYCILSF